MTTSTQAQPQRPGMKDGVASEFTVLTRIKPGHADALRDEFARIKSTPGTRAAIQQIGTLHDARHVIFDNDTRLLFASVFDGSWDTYIDDFGKTEIGENFGRIFSHTEGFPGITDPHVKDWFVSQQEAAEVFATSYPELTVQQIWKDQRVNEAFQAVLDTAEFRAALEHPANAPLLASRPFQRLLDEASR